MLTAIEVCPVLSVQESDIRLPPFLSDMATVPDMSTSDSTFQPAPVAQLFTDAQTSLGGVAPIARSDSVPAVVVQPMTLKPLGSDMPSDLNRPQRPSVVPPLMVAPPVGAASAPASYASMSGVALPSFMPSSKPRITSSMSAPPQQQQEPAATNIPAATGSMNFMRVPGRRHANAADGGRADVRAHAIPARAGLPLRHLLPLLGACTGAPSDTPEDSAPVAPVDVPWSATRAPLAESSPAGRAWRRGIVHLHSPYSHDACDGDPMPDGVPDEACLANLRRGLCTNAMDFAMITDHPAHAAAQAFADTLLSREGDEVVGGVANRILCDDGHRVLTLPGIEDELMPIGLDRPVADTPEERERLYNGSDAESLAAEIAAGATVLQAHTEGKPLELLLERQANGLAGVEIFNLHAMVDPTKREEDLGLEPFGYLDAIGPFMSGDTDAQPDLAFLGFFEEQGISLERWDALSRVAPTVGTAGTDAHENTLPNLLSDGERVDSYRRMMSWFSNIALVDGDSPEELQAAIAAGRLFVAFEVLGTPAGFHVGYGGAEMGGAGALGGTLEVTCPTLAVTSPRSGADPSITVTVYKDGAPWQTGCGSFPVTEAGVYRVRVDIVPHHLVGFLDDQAASLVRTYPWLYSNSFRLGL
jgi:hypothetical protein